MHLAELSRFNGRAGLVRRQIIPDVNQKDQFFKKEQECIHKTLKEIQVIPNLHCMCTCHAKHWNQMDLDAMSKHDQWRNTWNLKPHKGDLEVYSL